MQHEDEYVLRELHALTYTVVKVPTRNVDVRDVRMRAAFPFKLSFLKYFNGIDDNSYTNHNGECVIKMLVQHWSATKLTEIGLTRRFKDAAMKLYNSDDISNGITARMLEDVCKELKASCMGFDQTSKNFVKYIATKSHNYKAVYFYIALNHFYLITDSDAIAHIKEISEPNSTGFKTKMTEEEDKQTEQTTFMEN